MARNFLNERMKALLVAVAMSVGIIPAAHAQYAYCARHGEMTTQLGEKFQEKQIALGTIGQIAVMEIFVAATGTWTVVVTDVSGKSCIVAAGENWESAPVPFGPDA